MIAADTGRPVPGVQIRLGSHVVRTDTQGRYRLITPQPPNPLEEIRVEAAGFERTGWVNFFGAWKRSDGLWTLNPTQLDVTLRPTRPVEVRCVGIPAEQCASLRTSCLGPFDEKVRTPIGEGSQQEDFVGVHCLRGEWSVVQGGGVTARVAPPEDVALLDFRGVPGGLTARLPAGAQCRWWHVKRVGVAAIVGGIGWRSADCSGGVVRIDGLLPGRWDLEVHALRHGEKQTFAAAVDVAERMVDTGELGEIERGGAR